MYLKLVIVGEVWLSCTSLDSLWQRIQQVLFPLTTYCQTWFHRICIQWSNDSNHLYHYIRSLGTGYQPLSSNCKVSKDSWTLMLLFSTQIVLWTSSSAICNRICLLFQSMDEWQRLNFLHNLSIVQLDWISWPCPWLHLCQSLGNFFDAKHWSNSVNLS